MERQESGKLHVLPRFLARVTKKMEVTRSPARVNRRPGSGKRSGVEKITLNHVETELLEDFFQEK